MSRSPSPASCSGSPQPLTPRSKIRALLAAVDGSDDEGLDAIRSLDASTRPLPAPRDLQRPKANLELVPSDDSDESEEDVRPRGRLAARMQGTASVAAQPNSKPESTEQPSSDKQQQPVDRDGEDGNTADTESDDDALPQAPRRLKRKLVGKDASEDSAPAPRSASPSLFVSSPVQPSPAKSVADDEPELPALKSDRFRALVERKKQERLAREAEEEARKAERLERQEKILSELDANDSNVSDITDDEGGRKLTQEARPTRKASKKAIEEMNRETQRMNRNMQLAHEAKTRKKITTSSLFERFNFRPAGNVQPKTASSSRPSTPHSDVEMNEAGTPPTSPPAQDTSKAVDPEVAAPAIHIEEELDDLPSRDSLPPTAPVVVDKGKGKEVIPAITTGEYAAKPKRQVRVRLPQPRAFSVLIDEDDELEITTTTKDKINAVFDSIPAKKADGSHSLKALKALAQVKSPGKENRRRHEQPGMSMGELEASLYQRMRQQARIERDKRLNMLKAQGVAVQTAEERERHMEEVEDLVAKAREEARQIMALERADAKKNKGDGEEHDPLAWDDSDDEDFQDPADEADVEDDAAELSGSEEDGEADGEGDDGEDEEEIARNPFFDGSASEAEPESEQEQTAGAEETVEHSDVEMDDDVELPARRRPRKQVAVLSDDEAQVESTPRPKSLVQATPNAKSMVQATPKAPNTASPAAPGSVLRSARKNFIPGLPVAGPAGLGLTQIFAGTMDDSQMSAGQGPTQSMMPDFDNFPDSNFSATMDDIPQSINQDTQAEDTQGTTQGIRLNFSQSQMHGLDSLHRDMPDTQLSDILELEPSQDGGLQKYTPLKERFVEPPHSTVDTVVVGQEDVPQDSPLIRRGRLRRKMDAVPEVADPTPSTIQSTDAAPTAFKAIQEGAKDEHKKQLLDDFNRKKSKAKEMVEEQAEESEDEYQGLGGYDGEDSDNESAASVKDMIDDNTAGNELDEAKLAAFYADRERANDEKQVEQLFKDITSGMLRRKRGADYDLSDSDDGGEARRRMKRRQFAKMQKALFSDERVKKMAENPGNQAFLRTIEDRGSDDEMDFLDIVQEPTQQEASSSSQQNPTGQAQEAQQSVVPDSQPRAALGNASENRAPAPQRRTKAGKRPANIGEVRETLSNLLDEREGSVVPATEAGSDSEDEDGYQRPPSSARSDKENYAPNPRRSVRPAAVVDRISLKRNSSTSSNASHGASSFKVPALLRRATTNSFKSTAGSSSASSTGVSTPTFGGGQGGGGGFGNDAKIKKGAGKRSGVNAFARENERRAKMHEGERRREQKKVKGAERRVGVVGGLLGRGSFE